MLRDIYDLALAKQPLDKLRTTYNELQRWMNAPVLEDFHLKDISDRYHLHLEKAKLSLKEHNLLPRISCCDRTAGEPVWPIAIYLDHIRSAHNVGSILRTVECLRLGTVYFSEQTPPAHHKQVVDTSMGTVEHIDYHILNHLDSLPRPLIAMETSQEAISIHDFLFPESFTLIVGNEEYGCSNEILSQADHIITIPMRGIKNSLNVANAFSMAALEISRQRRD